MAVSSHVSKSGVTGAPIHSPRRSCRVKAPAAPGSQETCGGSAVIGLACRIQSVPSASIAHSTSCGRLRTVAMRFASVATAIACRSSIADSVRRRMVALTVG